VTGEVRLKLFGEGVESLKRSSASTIGALTLVKLRDDGKGGAIARFAESTDRAPMPKSCAAPRSPCRVRPAAAGRGRILSRRPDRPAAVSDRARRWAPVIAVENFGAGDAHREIEGPLRPCLRLEAADGAASAFMVPMLDRSRDLRRQPSGDVSAGMVLKADVLAAAIDHARAANPGAPVLAMTPRGKPITQARIRELAAGPGAIVLCGRFEGFDERIFAAREVEEVSLADIVLSGGEPAALAILDACVRLLPGVMGASASGEDESFESGLLEYPQYTRPVEWEGRTIPMCCDLAITLESHNGGESKPKATPGRAGPTCGKPIPPIQVRDSAAAPRARFPHRTAGGWPGG
jgi:hypothetical protein